MSRSRPLAWVLLGIVVFGSFACRRDPETIVATPTTGVFGGPGSGYVAQCSGWFPDWISPNPPPGSTESFQLSQGYYLGVPVIQTVDGEPTITGWNAPAPVTNPAFAPWLAHDFDVPAQRMGYLDALKNYALAVLPGLDFVPQKQFITTWFHVPMMTTSPTSRREPYHGVTKERALRADDHKWIIDAPNNQNDLDSFAIGFYNLLGSYTIGQVFKAPDPAASDPSKATFIDGTFVFKLIFAEYVPSKIDAALNPLDGAPEWEVQDVEAPADPLKKVRLLQFDIAVKDSRSTQTGWVFATFVYDKSITTEPNPWRRLTPVGLQWGNDPDVTAANVGTVDESWINPAVPSVFENQSLDPFGRHGRLNGPVDNTRSACISCHSTAQVVTSATSAAAFRGAGLTPPVPCTDTQDMTWFRNIVGTTPFGVMTGANSCTLGASPGTPPLHSLDYSLQLADGLQSALFYDNPNPCASAVLMAGLAARRFDFGKDPEARGRPEEIKRVSVDAALIKQMNAERELPRR